LAQALGPEQPFLDVTLPADTQDSFGPDLCVPRTAAAYVRVLKTVQPHGPYIVGGVCTNGIVAYEAACQLEAGGDTVGLVILVHAVNPVHFQEIGAIRIELSKAAYYLARMRQGDVRERWPDAIGHVRDAAARVVWNPRGVNATPNRFLDALERAAYRYCPGPSRFPVALFQPADRPVALDYRAGWRRLVSADFTADDIPGTHHTMLDSPHVDILAARLTEYLARRLRHVPAVHQAAE
jgi:thioesterase domain-containing protein